MNNDDSEAELDRALDESRNVARVARPERHRVGHAAAAVIVVASLSVAAAYAAATFALSVSLAWASAAAGLVIAGLAWGVTGSHRARATSTDRIDLAVSAVVGSVVFSLQVPAEPSVLRASPSLREVARETLLPCGRKGFAIANPPPLGMLFDRPDGLDGMPRFHHVAGWSAAAAYGAFALAAPVRLALEHRRA